VIFHSLDFVVFFLLTTAIYWLLPHRGQNILLVCISYFFYGYVHPWFLALIAATTIVDYWAARWMDPDAHLDAPRSSAADSLRSPAPGTPWSPGPSGPGYNRRRLLLALSLAVNLGLLGFFKYFGFFVDNVHAVLAVFGLDLPKPALSVLLPVGISFYTFQELSYTIEVYRGTLRARRDFIDFAAFVCFYPQLVAGPIERASHLLPQVESPRAFSWPAARSAMFLICWGYFKKLVIADNVGVIANKVFALQSPGFTVLWAGVFAFAIQIYADFSAYSDIARGVARWLGFDLMVNFNHPYMARGPVDFWRRWHISLSTWFRDYVYIPLGGSRGTRARTMGNIFVTFLVSGLWHGASWNYVLWGAYHGVLVVIARLLGRDGRSRAPRADVWAMLEPLQILAMFALACIGWLMFRETDIHMLLRDLSLSPWSATPGDRAVGHYLLLLAFLYSVPLWIHGIWSIYVAPSLRRPDPTPDFTWRVAGQTLLAGLALAAILVLRSQQSLDFIYFQF
jgi:alginate O-acetyltransferase complex protein AlgI